MLRIWFACGLPLLLLSCDPGLPPGFPPVARLTLTPEYVKADEASEIVLDGRASCDQIDAPESCDDDPDGIGPDSTCPGGVRFSWDIPFPHTVRAATPNRSQLRIFASIHRPSLVTLTVTDCDGRSHSVTRTIGVSD